MLDCPLAALFGKFFSFNKLRIYLLALLTMLAPTAMADKTKLTKVKPESDPDSGQCFTPPP